MSKAKGGGGGGGEDGKAVQGYKIGRQVDQEKIVFLSKRVEELLGSNNELRTSSSRNEKDTHDIVQYFQREVEMKDDIIARLNEELVKRETQLKFEVEKMKKKFQMDLNSLRTSTDHTITDLTSRLAKSDADLNAVIVYQQEKNKHDEMLKKLERSLQDQREEMFASLDEQEKRFLEEKAAVYRDLDEQKLAFREIAIREAREAMGEDAKRMMADNSRMYEELKFHNAMTAELQTDKTLLSKELAMAKRDVSILTDKELEYARQGYFKAKEIKALRERVEHLEKQQVVNTERFKHRTKELKATVHKELEEATLDAAGLRKLLKIKNKELLHMKTLAATILSQRTETETFFLESLAEVKALVKAENQRTVVDTKIVLNKLRSGSGTQGVAGKLAGGASDRVVAFPPLNVKGGNLHLLDARKPLEISHEEKVNIKDLSWEDKELVLRVLFAKMNGQQSSAQTSANNTMPPQAPSSSSNQKGGGWGPKSSPGAMPLPMPVFVSEGAFFDEGDELDDAREYQNNFLMRDGEGRGEDDDWAEDEGGLGEGGGDGRQEE